MDEVLIRKSVGFELLPAITLALLTPCLINELTTPISHFITHEWLKSKRALLEKLSI